MFSRLSKHRWAALGVLAVLVVAGGAVAYALTREEEDPTIAGAPPAPQVVIEQVSEPEEVEDLGFPEFATKNTTRVAGTEAEATAAAVSLAVHPSAGDVSGPNAVTLVESGDWQAAVAAGSLVADPVGAPILIAEAGEVPPLTENALRALGPEGSAATAGRQLFVLGSVAEPDGLETLAVEGDSPAELAAEVDRLRTRLADDPDHLLVTSSEAPGYALPAGAWSARSGDPVLFTGRDAVPEATIAALRRHDGVPVFVLGPESAISEKTMTQIERIAPGARRVGAEGVVENSIAFARFQAGGFGWNVNDPGHGFVIANTDRPVDAAVASPLSASGTWGPLLMTDDGAALPAPLRGYLLDLKPGYAEDPTRALYNHVWLIGDTSALSVALQAEADDLAEVAQVTSGSGGPAQPAGEPESEPPPRQPRDEPDR